MDESRLNHYKRKLLSERERVLNIISTMKENEAINSTEEISSELSFYDNHPSDLASELNDMERGKALQGNEMNIINKIDDAIKSMDEGTYGVCKRCGKEISSERLEFIPYAKYCVHCQNEISTIEKADRSLRPIEERALKTPFSYGYNDHEDKQVEFDAEDSYQAVAIFNKIRDDEDYYYDGDEDYDVEPIEKISNEQYKNQLPD